jgi:hypothetical protein
MLFCPIVSAQAETGSDTLRSILRSPTMDAADTLRSLPSRPATETTTDTAVGYLHPTKSPGTAMLFSALLPGAGQAYNTSYWKVPVVLGLGIYFVSEFLTWNRHYQDYRDQYNAALIAEPNRAPFILARRDVSRDNRDSYVWYYLILYVVNILDAYVDASLFDFNVGNDLSCRSLPAWTQRPDAIQVQLRIHF